MRGERTKPNQDASQGELSYDAAIRPPTFCCIQKPHHRDHYFSWETKMNETTLPLTSALARGVDATSEYAATRSAGAVSWGAIIAGAAGAAALSLILLILGTGLGLSSVSPWTGQGVEASTFSVSTIVWLTFTQLAASGMGGYLAGRLRTRWAATHNDEVYFRDTAHGFLAWAIATLATAALLTSAIGSILGAGAKTGGAVAAGAATTAAAALTAATGANSMSGVGNASTGNAANGPSYFIDSLFRKDAAAAPSASASAPGTSAEDSRGMSGEVARIFANAQSSGSMSADDTKYVGQLVAQRTGLSQADAEKRVTDTYARAQAKAKDAEAAAKDAADKARKASAYGALWLFVSLLVGAFVASLAATYGGRRRDLV